jgi:AcrR family transcriptional regulator
MPRRSRSQQTASTDDARECILAAAERCIDRHGIRKTTINDIASKIGLSRPSVYRYFADRDDLLIELITRHGQALLGRARESFSRQSGLPDQIVESLLYIADHGRRDPLIRYLIDPDGTSLGQRMMASGTSQAMRAEMWDPLLDAALARNELPTELPRSDIHLWLGNVGKMLMRDLDDGVSDLERYRSILHRFIAPAFGRPNAHVSA